MIHERLTEQFQEWELRGRGWHVWDEPVALEPPFKPLQYCFPETFCDDARRPTLLSSLLGRVQQVLSKPRALVLPQAEENEPKPISLVRNDVVELLTSLRDCQSSSREEMEQLFLDLNNCSEPISFEILADANNLQIHFSASGKDVATVEQIARSRLPEAAFTRTDLTLRDFWESTDADQALIFQLGLGKEFLFSLNTRNFANDPLTGLLAAFSALSEGERAAFQVLFTPTRNHWREAVESAVTDVFDRDLFLNAPELRQSAEKKMSRRLYAVIARLATKTFEFERTLDIARDAAGALTIFEDLDGNHFIPLENIDYPFLEHEEDFLSRQSRRCGMLLNSEELAALVHLPAEPERHPKLRLNVRRTKAAPARTVKAGLFLGLNDHEGVSKDVQISSDERVRHTYIVGASGTGKSTFLFNLISQDIASGAGVGVVDPHGDLIDQILGSIPQGRVGDVVLIDPSDSEYTVGFNILSAHSELEKNVLSSDLVSIFERLSTSWGDQLGSVFKNAVLAFLESETGGTLADVRRFLIEPDYRYQFLMSVKDPDIVYYWKKAFPLLSGNKSVGPLLTRLDTFLAPKAIRYMVSQRENKIDFADVMGSGKILLAKLSQGIVGKENAFLLGSLLMAKFQQTAMGRQHLPIEDRREFWLYADEFQDYISPSMAEIITGARKYKLGLILAHQEIQQLERVPEVASAVRNAYTRVCFRVGDSDARSLEKGFGYFKAKDLQNLGTGEGICRIERSDFDFNLSFPHPGELESRAEARRQEIIECSRKRYATARTIIEAALPRVSYDESPKKDRPAPPQPEAAVPVPVGARKSNEPAIPDVVIQPVAPPAVESVPRGEAYKSRTFEAGRGGNQHTAIQKRLKETAQTLGYSATIEKSILEGQASIDVFLESPEHQFAIEIAVTTTIDHEVGNVLKCLKCGLSPVVISTSEVKLRQIEAAVLGALGAERAASIRYSSPDQFIEYLEQLAQQDAKQKQEKGVKTVRGYKIRRSVSSSGKEDREREALGVIAQAMKSKAILTTL